MSIGPSLVGVFGATGATSRVIGFAAAALSGFVGRPEIGELGEQIVVRAYPVLRHLPICEDS